MMQKYKIFTKYHSVCITNQPLELLNVEGKDIIKCDKDNFLDLPFFEFLNEVPHKQDIILHVSNLDISKVFIECIKRYVFVQAAGGMVRNSQNELLFIYRNKRWDLPKGHKENNEDLDQTALREVEEECGLKDLILGEKLGITYHTYYLNGRYEIKETHWYAMTSDTVDLIPQKEEGIEKAVWIRKEEIEAVMENTYLSLKDFLQSVDLF